MHRAPAACGCRLDRRRRAGDRRAAFDKGAGKGAVIVVEKKIPHQRHQRTLATTLVSRPSRVATAAWRPHSTARRAASDPERKPDGTFETTRTRPIRSLIYAPSGDRNPPVTAIQDRQDGRLPEADHPRLCTYGTTCRAIITNVLDHRSETIRGYDVRFSPPAYPGETVLVDVEGRQRRFVPRPHQEREVVVINNGKVHAD